MVKQRITFQLNSFTAVDTDNLVLSQSLVEVPGSVFKNRQDRLTLVKDELPSELRQLLEDVYEFEITWSSLDDKADTTFQNFHPRGLSVHIVPGVAQYEDVFDKFGEYIDKNFHVGFTHENLVSTPTSATFHLYTNIRTSVFQKFIRTFVEKIDRLSFVTDFEIIWSNSELKIQWISSPHDSSIELDPMIRKEIALMESKSLAEDWELSGLRTILDVNEPLEPTKTLIFTKPRHQHSKNIVNIDLKSPIGLHPTIIISNISQITPPPSSHCELFLHAVIPNSLIFDKYQYDDKNLQLINSWGDNDLEAPIWKIKHFGSIQLFQFNNFSQVDELEITYHSRYLKPSAPSDFTLLSPQLFWGCDATSFIQDFELIGQNPFDDFSYGYPSYFEDTTVFYHIATDKAALRFKIPTGDTEDFATIQLVTLSSVSMGFLYILWKVFTSLFSKTTTDDDKKTK